MLDEFDTDWASPPQWATMYRQAGLQVVPAMAPGEHKAWKRPVIDWLKLQDERVAQPIFERWYGPTGEHVRRQNMGLVMGLASDGVFCLDLDVKPGATALEWWRGVLAVHANDMEPETLSQRTGGGGRQLLFRAPPGWSPPTFKTTTLGVDLRGQGGFMMAPPSRHESGREYAWEDGREPWNCDVAVAPDWLIEAIEKVREEHAGGATGTAGRERVASEGAKSAFGLDVDDREDKMTRAVWGVALTIRQQFADDSSAPFPPDYAAEEEAAWQRYLTTTQTRLPYHDGDTKEALLDREGRGRTDWIRKLNRALRLWNGKLGEYAKRPNPNASPATGMRVTEQDQQVTRLQVVSESAVGLFDPWERYLVPAFPLDTLCAPLKRFIDVQARSTGADASAVAMASLTACAGALDQQIELKMKRTGQWHVKPRLWTVLVGDPSSKKTPAIVAATRPLRQAETVVLRQHSKDMARWEEDKKDDPKATKPPPPLRYLVNDTTTEKLGELLRDQDRGLLVEHDELSGWIGAMDKYGGGSKGASADRAFWAQAYNGGPKTVDRLGRGSVFIENLCVSFLGGVQPDRLAALGDLASDGLLQRFLPVMMRQGEFPQEVEDEKPLEDYVRLHALLRGIKPGVVRMTKGALEAALEMQRFLHDVERTEGLGKSLCSFAGKLAGVHGSLALLLHCTDDPENAMYDEVEVGAVERASRILRDFTLPHARELYRTATDAGDWDHLRSVASFILTSDKARFTPSDFTAGVRGMRSLGLWDLGQKLSPLVAGGWLVEEVGGRAWTVPAGLRESFSARREAENGRKADVMRKLAVIRGNVNDVG